jgi:hypothetical protein
MEVEEREDKGAVQTKIRKTEVNSMMACLRVAATLAIKSFDAISRKMSHSLISCLYHPWKYLYLKTRCQRVLRLIYNKRRGGKRARMTYPRLRVQIPCLPAKNEKNIVERKSSSLNNSAGPIKPRQFHSYAGLIKPLQFQIHTHTERDRKSNE